MNLFQTCLRKYLDIFSNQEMYFVRDISTLELFKKIPLNTDVDDIQMKLSSINDTDISNNSIMVDVATHILQLKIDEQIRRGDLSVVEDIAAISCRGKSYHLLHFASVYCNFHRPDTFPIYSEQHIEFYKRYIVENKLPLDPAKMNTYEVFSKALDDLVERLGLTGKMNYLQLRKFGWLYAETVLTEANA